MPWKDVLPMEERIRFAVLAAKGTEVISDLCEQFGISRKTGYKWLRRYRELGIAGTRELSRRPDRCPHRTSAKIEALILRERRRHRSWGPKKLRELLRRGGIRGHALPFTLTTTWTYDAAGRPATETQGRAGRTLHFGYDGFGQRTAMEVTGGTTPWHTTYGYDNAGRLHSVLDDRLPSGQPYVYTCAGPN